MNVLDQIGEVVIPGLLIVFAALIILIFAVWVMGRVFSTRKKKDKPTPQAPEQASAPAAANVKASAPVLDSGIPGETVAAISSAVACYMKESAPGISYAIQSIVRPRQVRPVWGFAGMQQNTRPF